MLKRIGMTVLITSLCFEASSEAPMTVVLLPYTFAMIGALIIAVGHLRGEA